MRKYRGGTPKRFSQIIKNGQARSACPFSQKLKRMYSRVVFAVPTVRTYS